MSSIYRSLLNGFKNSFNHSPSFPRLHIPGNNIILSLFIFIIVLCIYGNLSAQITRKVLKTNELIKSTKAPEVSKPTILRDDHPIRLDMSSATLKNDFAALTNGDYSVISLVLPGSDKASDYYVKKSGSKLILNGDIVVKDFNILSTKSTTINDMTPALGVNQLYRWPNGTVPVVLDPSVFVDDKYIIIKSALDFFNFHTGIIFKERGDEDNYLVIKCVNDDTGKGGSTEVGRQIYGSNILQLVNGKFDEGTVLHELMHTLGVLHEQARTDRDNYIEINGTTLRKVLKKIIRLKGTPP